MSTPKDCTDDYKKWLVYSDLAYYPSHEEFDTYEEAVKFAQENADKYTTCVVCEVKVAYGRGWE